MLVISQWIFDTSMPNPAIAAAPTLPAIASSRGAIASSARASRSSLSSPDSMPNTSSTAQAAAQSPTRCNGIGLVNRFAISTSITCPCVTSAMSRTGHSSSTIPANSSRRNTSDTAGSPPKCFRTTASTATFMTGRTVRALGDFDFLDMDTPNQRPRPPIGHRHTTGTNRNHHVRTTGLAADASDQAAVIGALGLLNQQLDAPDPRVADLLAQALASGH